MDPQRHAALDDLVQRSRPGSADRAVAVARFRFFSIRVGFLADQRESYAPFRRRPGTSLPAGFPFGSYLGHAYGEVLRDVVDVRVTTWLCLLCGFLLASCALYGTGENPRLVAWALVVPAWGLAGAVRGLASEARWMVSNLGEPTAAPGLHLLEPTLDAHADAAATARAGGSLSLRRAQQRSASSHEQLPKWTTLANSSTSPVSYYDRIFRLATPWSSSTDLPSVFLGLVQVALIHVAVVGALFGTWGVWIVAKYHVKREPGAIGPVATAVYAVLVTFPLVYAAVTLPSVIENFTIASSVVSAPRCPRLSPQTHDPAFIPQGGRRRPALVASALAELDSGLVDLVLTMILSMRNGALTSRAKAEAVLRLPAHEHEALRRAFREADADNSGAIDEGELVSLLQRLGRPVTPEGAALQMKCIDLSGDGLVDLNELETWYALEYHAPPPSQADIEGLAAQFYEAYDTDRSGTLDADELQGAFGDMGVRLEKARIRALMAPSGQGASTSEELSREGFVALLQKHARAA